MQQPSKLDTQDSVIYLLRTVQQHHVHLSAMADQKANFLIAASFVILSVLGSQGFSGQVSVTMLCISGFTISAAFFAILAVMPRYRNNGRPRQNLLFFGDFGPLDWEDYLDRMQPILASNQDVHEAMLRDIYCLGQVLLHKKYRYLSWSYRIFLVGLVVTPIVWGLEALQSSL